MGTFAFFADFLVAVMAKAAVSFFGADVAAFHYLAAGWIRQFSGDFDVELEKTLKGDVGGESLHTLIRDAMFCTTFWTFNLEKDFVC